MTTTTTSTAFRAGQTVRLRRPLLGLPIDEGTFGTVHRVRAADVHVRFPWRSPVTGATTSFHATFPAGGGYIQSVHFDQDFDDFPTDDELPSWPELDPFTDEADAEASLARWRAERDAEEEAEAEEAHDRYYAERERACEDVRRYEEAGR